MFCTQCGIQIDPGDNFCRGCGAKLGRGSEPSPTYLPSRASIEPSAAVRSEEVSNRRHQTMPLSLPRDGVESSKTKIIAALVVVVLAAAGVYFGTDLLREPTSQESRVAKAPAAQSEKPPRSPATPADKSSSEGSKSSPSSLSDAIEPEAASPPPLETPAPAPKPASREPRVKSAGQDPLASNRANRPAAPVSASRRGTSGIYQTLRSTTLFESPSASSRSVANIPGGVRVNVVNASGDWLEVHSRRGNPPGFIRREDAQFIESGQ